MNTEAVMNLLINVLLYFTVAIVLHSILFFAVRLAKVVLFNSITLLVFLFPYYLQHSGYLSYSGMHLLSIAGLFMLPVTYSVMIICFYDLQDKHSYLPVFLVVACAVFINILIPSQIRTILISLQIILSLYIIFIVSTMRLNIPLRILGAAHILNIINSIYAFSISSDMYISISSSVLTLATFYILSLEYQIRLSRFIGLYRHSNELNKKLSHQITRLKQSNEQWKHIISEKDTELFQIARHASLAEITTGIAHELCSAPYRDKGV